MVASVSCSAHSSACIFITAITVTLCCQIQAERFISANKVTHARWKPLSLSRVCVCVCSWTQSLSVVPQLTWGIAQVSDHRCDDGRPPEMLKRRGTTWKERGGEGERKEVRRKKLFGVNWKCSHAERGLGVSIWNLDSGAGTDPGFHVVLTEQCSSLTAPLPRQTADTHREC